MLGKSKKTIFVCQACGTTNPKWLGRCPACGEWETLIQETIEKTARINISAEILSYADLDNQDLARIVTGNSEFDRVLGGGIVPGSLVLIGGEPGIGKSTLLLQVSEALSQLNLSVLYVAGEESPQQIRMRGERLGISGRNLHIYVEPDIESVLEVCRQVDPDILIVDSVQTMYSQKIESVPGSIGQIREAAMRFLKYSKKNGISTFLIGHITKDGALAGPKSLEHIVDVVLYFEGDRHQNQKSV